MPADEPQHALDDLQPGNVDVQIHPVDPFRFQGDVLLENLGHIMGYGHRRLRLLAGP